MTSPPHLRDLLLRYLLGELGPQEREEVDTRLIADPEFAAEFEEAQHDLLDEHAAGALTPADTIRVGQAIAENRAFARAAQMAAALRLAGRRSLSSAPDGLPGRLRSISHFRVPAWAIAACVLLILGGIVAGWRSRSASPTGSEMAQSPAARTPVAASTPAASESKAAPVPLGQARQRAAVLEATLLMPETSRSGEATVLKIAKGVQRVRVQWPVSADEPVTLTVLRNGNQVAQTAEAQPRPIVDGTAVATFALPASELEAGVYLFRIAPTKHEAARSGAAGEPPLVEMAVEVKRS